MKQYCKKPIIIEAVQYDDSMRVTGDLPDGVYIVPTNEGDMPVIHTLEGDTIVRHGDYIIRGIKGELYPCKPDIFEASYDAVDSENGPGCAALDSGSGAEPTPAPMDGSQARPRDQRPTRAGGSAPGHDRQI